MQYTYTAIKKSLAEKWNNKTATPLSRESMLSGIITSTKPTQPLTVTDIAYRR